jgi:hypothetical protein
VEDYEEAVCSGKFDFRNYELIEGGLNNPVHAIMSTFENKIFKFKYRMYQDSPDTHYIRENRMILRYLDRLKNRPDVAEVDQAKVLELYENEGAQSAYLYAKPYRDWVMDEAIQ